jgi:hypothetical protein
MDIGKTQITYIYALMDGDDIRYIGKSDNPNKRLNEHINYGYNKKSYKHNWVRKMLSENKEIKIKILEVVPYNIWGEREIYWINKHSSSKLTNKTIGGEGKNYPESLIKNKNLKITSKTHKILKKYCDNNGVKIFDFVEELIIKNIKLANEER